MNDNRDFETVVNKLQIARRMERIENNKNNMRAKLVLAAVTSMASGIGGVLTMARGLVVGREVMVSAGVGLFLASVITDLLGRDICDKIHRLDNVSDELKIRVMREMQRGK